MTFNILVVEDERAIREGFCRNLEKVCQFRVFQAENDKEAFKIIGENIIHGMLLDIQLPDLNGLEFLSALTEEIKNGLVTIIITGYDNFEYAQEALRQGVNDYILKPLTPEKIKIIGENLLAKLQKRHMWNEKYAFLLKEVEEGKPLIRERFLQDILSGKLGKEEFKDKCSFLNIETYGDYFCIAIIQFSREMEESNFQARLRYAFNYLEERVKNTSGGMLFPLGTFSFILLTWSETINGQNDLFNLMNDTALTFFKEGMPVSRIAIGDWLKGPENIVYSYLNANKVLMRKDLYVDDFCFAYKDLDFAQDPVIRKDDRPDIGAMLGIGDKAGVIAALMTETSFLVTGRPEITGLHFYDIFLPYIQALVECLCIFRIEMEEQVIKDIETTLELVRRKSYSEAREGLILLVDKVSSGIEEVKSTRQGKIVSEIKDYIYTHIKEQTSQAKLAVRFGYSPNYLGYLFKKETGITINEFINQEKIEKAKKLIGETNLLVSEVALALGFSDQYYFSTVFKKYAGVSPSEYRGLR